MSNEEIKKCKLPFYSWECITIQLKNRDVLLVIKNEKCMMNFIKLLIDNINTVDGKRDSAKPIREALYREKFEAYKLSEANNRPIEEWRIKKMIELVNHQLMRKTCLKYQILKIRSKLSYICFEKRCTLTELLLKQILTSYNELIFSGEIKQIGNLSPDESQCLF